MGNRKKRRQVRERQLAFDFVNYQTQLDETHFASRVDVVLERFRRDAERKGPKSAGRELGLAYVEPHWRRIGGAR